MHWLGYDWEIASTTPRITSQDVRGSRGAHQKDLAFVDELSADEIRETRGTLTEPGQEILGVIAQLRKSRPL